MALQLQPMGKAPTPPTPTKTPPLELVMQWLDECEASAPPPSQLAFSIHLRNQLPRLAELLG